MTGSDADAGRHAARGVVVKDDAATVEDGRHRASSSLERTMSSGTKGGEGVGKSSGGDGDVACDDGSPMLSPILGASGGEDGRARREERDASTTPESPNLRPAAGDAGSGMYDASFRFDDDDDDDNNVSRSSDAVSFESANVSMAVNTTRGSEFHSMYRTADLDEFSDDEFSASSKRRRPRLFGAVKPLLAFVAGFITVSLVVGEAQKRREREVNDGNNKEDGRTSGR